MGKKQQWSSCLYPSGHGSHVLGIFSASEAVRIQQGFQKMFKKLLNVYASLKNKNGQPNYSDVPTLLKKCIASMDFQTPG